MLKTLMANIKQFKKQSILAPVLTAAEVLVEILIPYVTAIIIDDGIQAGNLSIVYKYGALMLVMAFVGLLFGALAGKTASVASTGLAKNLREAMYGNVQT
ncbi:MAG TPA: ABC transporter ATP-binding protein, partial [Clostridiales bacterium]|nr:ABC transporter ATP-binding protein [Clostridiales bacterium]